MLCPWRLNWPESIVNRHARLPRKLSLELARFLALKNSKLLAQAILTLTFNAEPLLEVLRQEGKKIVNHDRAGRRPWSSTPASIPTTPNMLAICATPPSEIPSCDCCVPPTLPLTRRTTLIT